MTIYKQLLILLFLSLSLNTIHGQGSIYDTSDPLSVITGTSPTENANQEMNLNETSEYEEDEKEAAAKKDNEEPVAAAKETNESEETEASAPSSYGPLNRISLGSSVPRLALYEFERSIPNTGLSAYLSYGSGEIEVSDSKTKISGYAIGLRQSLIFGFFLGVGYESLSIDYTYTQTIAVGDISVGAVVNVNGKFNGPLVEIGNNLNFGPITIGTSAGAIFGKPTEIVAKANGETAPSDDVNQGLATVEFLPQVQAYIGYSF